MKDIIRTPYLNKIRPFYNSKYIKVITGIRRCGKSTILNQIQSELVSSGTNLSQIISIDLESEQYCEITTIKQLLNIVKKKIVNKSQYYIFIDEIQRIDNFEIGVAAIRNSYNCSLFITGSNSQLLQGKLQDRLTGRAKEFEILPFTFSEVLEFKKINNISLLSLDREFKQYIKFGGMPQLFEEVSEDGKLNYLRNLFISIIHKDVFSMHKRINKDLFIKLSKYIISNCGKAFSALSLAKELHSEFGAKKAKSFSKTINSYADYLKECYFIKECSQEQTGTKRNISGVRKFYNIDTGFRFAVGTQTHFEQSFALENIIYNELLYRDYVVHYGKHNSNEIDFIATKNNIKYLIQVTYILGDDTNFDREIKPLQIFKKIGNKYILSLDSIDRSFDNIKNINIIDFITRKESL